LISKLDKVVECPIVDNVEINKAEMDDLAEIVREAAYEKNRKKDSDKAKTSYGH
jgi:hypothetical protein